MSRAGCIAALLTLACALGGCGVDEDDVRERRSDTLQRGAARVGAELTDMVERCRAALLELAPALEGAAAPGPRFDAVESLRKRHGLDGLVWDGPSGESVWAGRLVEPRPLPADSPWERSFSAGNIAYHDGPFLRALIYGPIELAGGRAAATVILEQPAPAPESVDARPFHDRWLIPLELRSVEIVPPGTKATDLGDTVVEVTLPKADEPLFGARVAVSGTAAISDRIAQTNRRNLGIGLLVMWLAAVLVLRRFAVARIRPSAWRWTCAGLLVLLARGALRWVDIPHYFPGLSEPFSPAVFSVETPLGWLRSPADFALTALAFLFAGVFLRMALVHIRRPGRGVRAAVVIAAPFAVAMVVSLWLALVHHAVAGGSTPFFEFEAGAFAPRTTTALMLTGLVAMTATVYLLAALALKLAWVWFPVSWRVPKRTTLVVASVVLTWVLAITVASAQWAALGIPLIAGLMVGRKRSAPGLALPSRVLLLSVLSTVLLFPVLWVNVQDRECEELAPILEDVLQRELTVREGMHVTLARLQDDAHLRRSLSRARDGGPVADGLALHVWLQTEFRQRGDPGVVSVLDEHGALLDQFSLAAFPPTVLWRPTRPTDESDEQVLIKAGDGNTLRSVIGRLRIRDAESNEPIGHVVLTVPDLLDLELQGRSGLIAPPAEDSQHPLVVSRGLPFAVLQQGVVVASNDDSIPRDLGSFGPSELGSIPAVRETLSWRTDTYQGYAAWSDTRSAVFAVRRALSGTGDALLALARLVVVGVGLGALAAFACLLAVAHRYRGRLHHRILISYLVVSIIPLILLGMLSTSEAGKRHEAGMETNLSRDLARARGYLEGFTNQVFDRATSRDLVRWAADERFDAALYRESEVYSASRSGLVAAELLPPRLPAAVYRATVLERRQIIVRDANYAGRRVWIGYAPVLDDGGETLATVAVPLLYQEGRVQQELTTTGSVLVAGYLLALVVVLVVGIYAARNLAKPLGLLASGTKRVASGELDLELPGEGPDELGQLVAAFNQMTRELRETTERAARAERESAWRRMARQVAHEIRNPLTPIRLMIQQLQAEVARNPEDAREVVEKTAPVVLRQIQSLDRIAGDFANFARLPKRNVTDVDVRNLVEHVASLHDGAHAMGVEVTATIEGALPTVRWDEEEMRRVLLNLVVNAVQSIPENGTVSIRAKAETRGGNDGVLIAVRDDGIGIEDQNLGRLFDPHFSTKTKGTGLGLAIVARIVQDMGGTIDVSSEPNKGSTFRLWWPAGPENQA